MTADRIARAAVVAVGVLLTAAGALAIVRQSALTDEVRRLLRASGTDTSVFGQIGRLDLEAGSWGQIGSSLLSAGVVAILAGTIALVLRGRIAVVRRGALWSVLLVALVLGAGGALIAVDYSRRQGLTGRIPDPSTASAVSVFQSATASAAIVAGGIALLLWLTVRALVAREESGRWLAALVVVAVACAIIAVALLQLRAQGYTRMQDLYANFYTESPDPRIAGREILALQARDLLLSTLEPAALALAAIGIPFAIAARALRAVRLRLGSAARDLVPDGEAHA